MILEIYNFNINIYKSQKDKYNIPLPFVVSGLLLIFNIDNYSYDVYAQDTNITIETTKLTDSIYMLQGSEGNILVSIGIDGAFIVDDQFVSLTAKIKDAISKITDKPIKFVINTHWHQDHTGGNANLGEAGALIVSHDSSLLQKSLDSYIKILLYFN